LKTTDLGDEAGRYRALGLDGVPQLEKLDAETRFAISVTGRVLPFRVNRYVAEELIDWSRVPDDPIFRLTFPQPGMLDGRDFGVLAALTRRGAPAEEIAATVERIRADLNPHPAGQMDLNVPRLDGRPLAGIQHKYPETVLFFPSRGQTCHAFCSFCYRWPQFVGDRSLRFAARDSADLVRYLSRHHEVSDLLLTGGDPLVMKASHLAEYLDPVLAAGLDHVRTVRIGTKALTYWPQRFVTDPDADDLLRLLERLAASGRHVAIMAHFNHGRELEPAIAREAIRRLRDAGATIRAQAPLLRGINDDPAVWADLWRTQVSLGIVPYYMFVARDTGPRRYFEVSLARAAGIWRHAVSQVSGLARTVRGPSMSCEPGKVEVSGIARIGEEKVFVLRFLQARDPAWTYRPFFARFDPQAAWIDDLEPALGASCFFFEDEMEALRRQAPPPGRAAAVNWQ
jgi:KamA family protein